MQLCAPRHKSLAQMAKQQPKRERERERENEKGTAKVCEGERDGERVSAGRQQSVAAKRQQHMLCFSIYCRNISQD